MEAILFPPVGYFTINCVVEFVTLIDMFLRESSGIVPGLKLENRYFSQNENYY